MKSRDRVPARNRATATTAQSSRPRRRSPAPAQIPNGSGIGPSAAKPHDAVLPTDANVASGAEALAASPDAEDLFIQSLPATHPLKRGWDYYNVSDAGEFGWTKDGEHWVRKAKGDGQGHSADDEWIRLTRAEARNWILRDQMLDHLCLADPCEIDPDEASQVIYRACGLIDVLLNSYRLNTEGSNLHATLGVRRLASTVETELGALGKQLWKIHEEVAA
jgi:hypothetical protein